MDRSGRALGRSLINGGRVLKDFFGLQILEVNVLYTLFPVPDDLRKLLKAKMPSI